MPSPRRSTHQPRTLKTDLANLRRDGFFHDLSRLTGWGAVVGMTVVALAGAALGVVSIFDAIH